ncbi:MAG: DUF5067 domain-containing protein [Bacilli bacterium]|nr:DUF5067 domain-containing protein [Bacilli bacterium]
MKKCLFCKAEVQKSEKICPNCGKRCFSRKWLILLVALAIILIVGIFGDSEEDNYQEDKGNSNNTVVENKGSKKEKKKYGLNEPVIITTSAGSYRLTFTGVTETSERNRYSDTQANRVILISYEYENIDSEENVYIFDSNFKIYDNENNSLETYPVSDKAGESVSIGRKTNATMAYALNSNTNHIEIEHYSNMFNSKYDCIFEIEW